MVRDFFAFLTTQASRWIVMPGSGEQIWLGDAWLTKAQAAHATACTACQWEDMNLDGWAAGAWSIMFGSYVGPVVG